MLQRLPITLAQVEAGNTSENLHIYMLLYQILACAIYGKI